jgi:hypothetical protein
MTTPAMRTKARTYALLLLIESLTALIILMMMIPIYGAISAALGHQLKYLPTSRVMLVSALLLFQCTYWLRLLRIPVSVDIHSWALSHLVLFVGRLSFIFGTSFFALVMYRFLPALNDLPDLRHFVSRLFVALVILFSLYCYSTELERLGVALRPPVKS